MATAELDMTHSAIDPGTPSNARMILATSGLMTSLSLVAVSLRVWVRQVKLKACGKDDALIIFAMVRETVQPTGTERSTVDC